MVASLVTLPGTPAVARPAGRLVEAVGGDSTPNAAVAASKIGFWHRLGDFRHAAAGRRSAARSCWSSSPGLAVSRVDFGVPDERVLPADSAARVQPARLTTEFASNEGGAFPVIARQRAAATPRSTTTAMALSSLAGVGRVDAPTGRFHRRRTSSRPGPLAGRAIQRDDAVRFNVVPTVPPISDAAERLVSTIRTTRYDVATSSSAADRQSSSTRRQLSSKRLPWAIAIIALATFVLLFLMFGVGGHPAQGDRAQHALADGDVRGHGLGLPGRPPRRAPGLHRRPG